MTTENPYVTLTLEQLEDHKNEHARMHVLQMIAELQEWKDKKLDIQNYILLKKYLYTYNRN